MGKFVKVERQVCNVVTTVEAGELVPNDNTGVNSV